MLLESQVGEVLSLLAQGLSNCRINKITGVARTTIKRIKRGERGLQGNAPVVAKKPQTPRIQMHSHHEEAHRCPTCAGMVYGDCLKCLIDASRKRNPEPCKTFALSPAGRNTPPQRCPDCNSHLYVGESVPCTLCVIRESIARGGEHTNVEMPDVAELAAISVGLGTARKAAFVDAANAKAQEPRYTLTAKAKRYIPTPKEIEAATAELRKKRELMIV